MATPDLKLDSGMPQSLDAEQAILGAILLDNTSYNEAAEVLRPEDFYSDGHRRLFARIAELMDAGRPVDAITLTDELLKKRELEAIGGVAYIASLTDALPRRPSIAQYVRIVRDKSLLRRLIKACNATMATAVDQMSDAADIIDEAERVIFEIAENKIAAGFLSLPEVVKQAYGNLDKFVDSFDTQDFRGLKTHYSKFDEKTRGLQPMDLIIIAARPSMGKTAFAVNIAENAAVLDNKVVGIFSLEMSREALLERMLCSQAKVDSHRLRNGFLPNEDRRKLIHAATKLMEAPIYIDDTPGISLTEMRAKARRLKAKGQLDLIIVDYLQLMSGGGGRRYENRTQEVSDISRGLKKLAKEIKAPVIALSQLSRAPETRGKGEQRPQLSDLRESGSIEQDADVVAFLFREEYYVRDKEDIPADIENIAEVIIAKQRNGPTGTVKLVFQKEFTRFENLFSDT